MIDDSANLRLILHAARAYSRRLPGKVFVSDLAALPARITTGQPRLTFQA
jgi:hypothetical protein